MAEVVLEGVHKTYQTREQLVQAVIDLNLKVEDGEFVALLGPSGCGKTSTLRMIVGLETITSGRIYIGGRLVNHLRPRDRDVGLAFETYALYPPLNVHDNLAFCLRARGMPREEIEKRVLETARMLNIEDILHHKPAQLSSGQKQLVSLARALVRHPSVLLMDEPLSHLDAQRRQKMRTELKRLQYELGTTTILVTHDQIEALAMADRVAVMSEGVLQQYDAPQTIYDEPANLFVAQFVGEPPMNFLNVVPEAHDGGLIFRDTESGTRVQVADDRIRRTVEAHGGDRFILGVRPEKITCSGEPTGRGCEVAGTVFSFQSLGEEGHLAVKVGETIFTVITEPEREEETGATVWLSFEAGDIHLFDANTQQAVRLSREAA